MKRTENIEYVSQTEYGSCSKNRGINNVDVHQGWKGDSDPWLLYAGKEQGEIVKYHRAIFLFDKPQKRYYENGQYKTAIIPPSQYLDCILQTSTSLDTEPKNDETEFCLIRFRDGAFLDQSEDESTWATLRGWLENNNPPNHFENKDGNDYYANQIVKAKNVSKWATFYHAEFSVPSALYADCTASRVENGVTIGGIAFREHGDNFLKFYSRFHGSGIVPQLKVLYPRTPYISEAQYNSDNNNYAIEWSSDIDTDEKLQGYALTIDNNSFKELSKGVFSHSGNVDDNTIINLFPNGKRTIRIRGKYKNADNATVYSEDYGEAQLIIARKAKDVSIQAVGTSAVVTWKPPSNKKNLVAFTITLMKKVNGVWQEVSGGQHTISASESDGKTSYSYTYALAYGDIHCRIVALYEENGLSYQSAISYSPVIHIHSPISFAINTSSTGVQDPNANQTMVFSYYLADMDTPSQMTIILTKNIGGQPIQTSTITPPITKYQNGETWGEITYTFNPAAKGFAEGDLVSVTASLSEGGQNSNTVTSYFYLNSCPEVSAESSIELGENSTISFTFLDNTVNNTFRAIQPDYCSRYQLTFYDYNQTELPELAIDVSPTAGQIVNGSEVDVELNLENFTIRNTYYVKITVYDSYNYSNSSYTTDYIELPYPEYGEESYYLAIEPPNIFSLKDLSGQYLLNSTFSLSGSYFGDLQNNSLLRFTYPSANELVTPISWSDTEIQFTLNNFTDDLAHILQIEEEEDRQITIYTSAGSDAENILIYDWPIDISTISPQTVTANKRIDVLGNNFTGNINNLLTNIQFLHRESGVDSYIDADIVSFAFNDIGCFVPEEATIFSEEGGDRVYLRIHKLYAKEPYSDNIGLYVKRCPDLVQGDYTFYWGQICSISAVDLDELTPNFGDRQGSSRIILGGLLLKTNAIISWTDDTITFWFDERGFDLSSQPNGTFPFGEKILLSVLTPWCSGGKQITVQCWKSKEQRVLQSSAVVSNERYSGEDTEMEGLTLPSGEGGEDEKAFRLVRGDISFKNGSPEFITKRPKLLQDILIAILTPRGNDAFHPYFGVDYQFTVGNVFDHTWQTSQIEASLLRMLNYKIQLQKLEMQKKYNLHKIYKSSEPFAYDAEIIELVRDIKVEMIDCGIKIYLRLLTKSGNVVNASAIVPDINRSIGEVDRIALEGR